MSAHTCHAHGCTKAVPARMFACLKHWNALPGPVKRAIWREYRPGQEHDKQPSYRYMAVQRIAVMHTAFRPNDEAAALAAAGYLRDALLFRKAAIAKGQGDPLEGLLPADAEL